MTAPAFAKGISALTPVRAIDGNPYLKRLLDGAREELSKPDVPWRKSTAAFNPFDGISGPYGSRDTAAKMDALFWLFTNPASARRGDPEVLTRLLRRSLAYADAIDTQSVTLKAGANIFDDFAIAPAATVLREFSRLYPGMLLPCQQAQWDRAMRKAGAIMWEKAKDRTGVYANIDLSLAVQLLNFGLYLNDSRYLQKARFLVDAQEANVYPDGGIAYIGHQNESHGYHDSDARDLARYYEISGYEKSLALLKRMEWYGPVTSGRLAEFWTVPSWKGTWNSNSSTPQGGEWVAGVTGNSYLRGMLDTALAKPADSRHWALARLMVAWWRNDVKSASLPDNATWLDRNIAGPRAWYERFNYAASLRSFPNTEPGLATLMGCQVTEPDFSLEAAVMGVFQRVRLKKDIRGRGGEERRDAYAWLTSGLQSSLTMGREFSAFSAEYRLHAFGSSTKGPDSDWLGRQIWLGLPDRIIGLLEVNPSGKDTMAWEVNGVVRLGIGGTSFGRLQKIERLSANRFAYGDLTVNFHENNYAAIESVEVPFRVPKAPLTDILLREEASMKAGGGQPLKYNSASHFYYVVEIRPKWAVGEAVVHRNETGGLLSLRAEVHGKTFIICSNFGNGRQTGRLTLPAGILTSIRASGSVSQTRTPAPVAFELGPHQQAVLIASGDPRDHVPGWESYQQMLANPRH